MLKHCALALLCLASLPAVAQEEKFFPLQMDKLEAPFAEVAKGRSITFPFKLGDCSSGGTPFCGYETEGVLLVLAFGTQPKGPIQWFELHGTGDKPTANFVTASSVLMRVFDPGLSDDAAIKMMADLLAEAAAKSEAKMSGTQARFTVRVSPVTYSFTAEPL